MALRAGKGPPCTDANCRAPGHGCGHPHPELVCELCRVRIDNPLCVKCHGSVTETVSQMVANDNAKLTNKIGWLKEEIRALTEAL